MRMFRNGGVYSMMFLTALSAPSQSSVCFVGNDDDDDNPGGDDDPDDAFTRKFNKLFHKASSERDKRLEQKLMKNFDASLGTKIDELKSILIDTDDDDDDDDQPGDHKSSVSPEMEARFRQMEKDAKEAKTLAEKWEKTANEEKARNTKNEELTQLSSLLSGAVKPALMDMVVSRLHGENLKRDPESGALLFKNGDELLPLKDGVTAWLKSDVGKELQAPREARGSGGTGGPGGGLMKPGEMTMEILGGIVSGSTGSR